MVDYAPEDIDNMDDDAGNEQGQDPPITGRWTTTSTYDVYMVDTPKEDDDDSRKDPVEDKPADAPPKHRRQRRRSKPCSGKDNNTGTGNDNTRITPKTLKPPLNPHPNQRMWRRGKHPDDPVGNEDSEDSNYLPISEDDVASVMKTSLCQRNHSSRSALSAS